MLPEPRYPFSEMLPVVEAVEVGQRRDVGAGIWSFDHEGFGRMLLVDPVERVAAWTDELLGPMRWCPLPDSLDVDPGAQPWERPQWTFNADLTLVAVFGVGELSIHDALGVRFRRAHPPGWDPDTRRPRLSGVFIGHILWCVVTEAPPDRHRLMVIDCQDWREIFSAVLESSSPEGFSLWGHPSQQGVVIDAGRGQDGTDLWTARREPEGLAIHRLDRDDQAFSGAFLNDGTLLVLPHTGETVSVYSWPNLEELAHLPNSDVFAIPLQEGGDGFDWCGFPIEDRYLMLKTVQGRLVLVDRRHRVAIAEVRLPGYGWQSTVGSEDPNPDPDLFAVRRIASTRFVADHEQRVDNTIWALPLEKLGH